MRLSIEKYSRGIELHYYRMIILDNEETKENEKAKIELTVPEKEKDSEENEFLKPNTFNQDKQEDDGDIDTRRELIQDRGFNEIKQNINSKSSGFHVTTMNRGVHVLILIILALVSTQFALMITERNKFAFYTDVLMMSNKRLIYVGLIHSQVFANKRMAIEKISDNIDEVDLYEYLREYGTRSIRILNNAEKWMNTASFDYSEGLKELEKMATINLLSIGNYNNVNELVHTLNTAITQYTSKSSDIMSYTKESLNTNDFQSNSLIYTQYFFVVRNGLVPLPDAIKNSVNEYTTLMHDRLSSYLKYYIIITVILGLSVIICFGVIVPKLIGLVIYISERVCNESSHGSCTA